MNCPSMKDKLFTFGHPVYAIWSACLGLGYYLRIDQWKRLNNKGCFSRILIIRGFTTRTNRTAGATLIALSQIKIINHEPRNIIW
jgi:hypothetical protein